MEKLRELISEEIIKINEELALKDEKQDYYREFFSKNDPSTIRGVLTTNFYDIAIAIIARKESVTDIEKIKTAVYKNKTIFEILDKEGYDHILGVSNMMISCDFYDDLYTLLKSNKKYVLKNPFSAKTRSFNLVLKLIKKIQISEDDFANFIELDKLYHKELVEALSILASIRKFKHEFLVAGFTQEEAISQLEQIIEENRGYKVGVELTHNWDVKGLLTYIQEAKSLYLSKEEKLVARKKQLLQDLEMYKNLEQTITSAKENKEIKNISEFINKIPSKKVRKEVLKLIYKHNMKYYINLKEDYEQLMSNEEVAYQTFLSKHGITPEEYDVKELINVNNLENAKKIIKHLTKLKITDKTSILEILKESNLKTIKYYTELIEKEIISPEFIIEHKKVLNLSSEEYHNFTKNYKLIIESNLYPTHINQLPNYLLISHDIFKENIEILQEYDLIKNIKPNQNYDFLSKENITEKIDLLLELGYEKQLEEYPALLNYEERFDRLKVIKLLNIPITTKEDLIKVLTTDNFLVANSEINDYLYNAVDNNIPTDLPKVENEPQESVEQLKEKLNQYSETARTYNINGVIISKNKVSRNLKVLDDNVEESTKLLYGVMTGSFLSDEEIVKLTIELAPEKYVQKINKKR